ncbi:MAG TPA: hypothetical protein VFA22_08470, partial [Stellaceae bacterium]|nr:hypothetical protein [Stellaceae bacterium]
MEIAAVKHQAARAFVGEFACGDKILPADLGRVEAQLGRRAIHQPLERKHRLRSAVAAVQSGGQLVREDHGVRHCDVADAIGPVQVAVHAIECRRLGRPQIGADVIELVEAQAEQRAVRREGAFDLGDAFRRGRGRRQVFESILDPLHRHAGLAARERHQNDIRINSLLDAEAAAAERRRDQPKPCARHAQRAAHQQLKDERTLEIAPDRVAIGCGLEVRNHAVGFDRRRIDPWIPPFPLHDPGGFRESRFGIAVAELPVMGAIASHIRMQHGCIRRERRLGIDD